MTSISLVSDPIANLPSEIIKMHLAPLVCLNKSPNILLVSKLWNNVLGGKDLWHDMCKLNPFIKKEHEVLSIEKPRMAYFKNDELCKHVENRLCAVSSVEFKGNLYKLQKQGNEILANLNERLVKLDPKTLTAEKLRSKVVAFTKNNSTLTYMNRNSDLYRQEKDSPPFLIIENMNNLDDGTMTVQPDNAFYYETCFFNNYAVFANVNSGHIHIIDDSGTRFCKQLPYFTVLHSWNNQLVMADLNGQINFYDEKLKLLKIFTPNPLAKNGEKIITSLINYNDSLMSAGFDQTIKLWNEDGTFVDISKEKKVFALCQFGKYVVSAGDDGVTIFDLDHIYFKLELPSFQSDNVEIIANDGKVLVTQYSDNESTFIWEINFDYGPEDELCEIHMDDKD
ncbi:MAG: hypothetical protein JHC93_07960 [Parachlamydiales bacterium]|nr:hypothetical protein [Parachlamydiales bacterium]